MADRTNNPDVLDVAVAGDVGLVPERLPSGLAQRDRHVLHGVVVVDVKVSVTPDREVQPAVFGEEVEHVVEEADAGVDVIVRVLVDAEPDMNPRLLRLAPHFGTSGGKGLWLHSDFSASAYVRLCN